MSGGADDEDAVGSGRPEVSEEELKTLRELIRGEGRLDEQERTMLAVALAELEWRRSRRTPRN